MPYLRISTNIRLTPTNAELLLTRTSRLVADTLGKSEKFVMVAVDDGQDMMFAGNADPCAYLELKSIGLQPDQTNQLSKVLCNLLESTLDLPGDRVYIEFKAVERSQWGWNGKTFA